MRLVFSALDHDLYICGACCNYFLCSLDPGESIGNNYSITQRIKMILTQEEHIFSVLSKSNVDEAQIQVEISTLWKNHRTSNFKAIYRKNKKWYKKNGDVLGVAEIDALQVGKKIILISHTVIFLETKTSTRPKTLI